MNAESQVAQGVQVALSQSGIIQNMELLGNWVMASLAVLIPSLMVVKVSQNIVCYLVLQSNPNFQQIKFQRSTFNVYPEDWEDCRCLSWNWKGIQIYVESTRQIVSLSNTGFYKKDILINSQRSQDEKIVKDVVKIIGKKK